MRLFVAVELDETTRKAAETAAKELRERLKPALNPKWISPANMHLTVRFIGHVADERVPIVLDALAPSLEMGAFDIGLSECGAFPPHGPPRALWIGLRDGAASLSAMHYEFNRRLLVLGLQPEARPYTAHLTLARIKDAPRGSGRAVREAIAHIHVTPTRCRIQDATVFESRLSPKGSTYVSLLRVPLRSNW